MAEKQKLSGMEMMMQSLMRAAGFNPDDIAKATVTVVQQMQNGLKAVSDGLTILKAEQELAKTERRLIMQHLGIAIQGEIILPEQVTQQSNGKDHSHAEL